MIKQWGLQLGIANLNDLGVYRSVMRFYQKPHSELAIHCGENGSFLDTANTLHDTRSSPLAWTRWQHD